MKTGAVIVAAGRGTRAGGPVPKQWRMLRGRTVVAWTLDAWRAAPQIDRLVLVLRADDMDMAAGYEAHGDVTVVEGGATRAASVLKGLEALDAFAPDRVLVHDVARPLVSQALIARVCAALDEAPAAAPALPVTDALWRGEGAEVVRTLDRDGLYRAQTPQGFHFASILAAHRLHAHAHANAAADDVEIARAAGIAVRIVAGEEANIKITTADDFARAEQLMGQGMDIRIGNGFDVHAFCEGDSVILCGLSIPHDRALCGHSDADVGMHAVTDAIYGAMAAQDIGQHFPPGDPQWKGAPSHVFLTHAVELARDRGYAVSNVDCTLICEAPRIGPHAAEMAAIMAGLMEIEPGRVSIKATTTETLGFTGRREGIAALATVTLVSV